MDKLLLLSSDFIYKSPGTIKKVVRTMIAKLYLFCSLIMSEISGIFSTVPTHKNILPSSVQDEVDMTIPEIITKYGYPVENHNIITKDGYILTMHRIPYRSSQTATKGPILLMHGVLGSSADWIIMGINRSLGYILADEGYDVWLANTRGNRYSRNHTVLNPNSKEFWQFSWHEIGYYDAPAMVDYILDQTQAEKLSYVGHSQGTTAFYVMCSEKPEYNKKIKVHLSLAPIAFTKHVRSPIVKLLARFYHTATTFLNMAGIYELLPTNGLLTNLTKYTCGNMDFICKNLLFLLNGFSPRQLNSSMLPLIMAHIPAGSATRQLMHFGQEIRSGKFCRFDHGPFKNLKYYNSIQPPEYDVSKIEAPMYFFCSRNDFMSAMKDVEKLEQEVKSLRGKFLISDHSFNHMDYLFAIDAHKILYPKVIDILTEHL